jgi:hypothetical protein
MSHGKLCLIRPLSGIIVPSISHRVYIMGRAEVSESRVVPPETPHMFFMCELIQPHSMQGPATIAGTSTKLHACMHPGAPPHFRPPHPELTPPAQKPESLACLCFVQGLGARVEPNKKSLTCLCLGCRVPGTRNPSPINVVCECIQPRCSQEARLPHATTQGFTHPPSPGDERRAACKE